MNASFTDNFSKQAALYARLRPHYPAALFQTLAALCKEHKLAWDCGTGNGQAAVALAAHFDTVIATDPSTQQISHSIVNEKIRYRVEPAENSSLENASANLLTIANAVHWFKLDEFYTEARRVLKPDGIIAAWCYAVPSVNPEVDAVLAHYDKAIVGQYWTYENHLVADRYRDLVFPFEKIEMPEFTSTRMMNRNALLDYLRTWSATQKHIADKGFDPTSIIEDDLKNAWPHDEEEKTITWPLTLLAGRVG